MSKLFLKIRETLTKSYSTSTYSFTKLNLESSKLLFKSSALDPYSMQIVFQRYSSNSSYSWKLMRVHAVSETVFFLLTGRLEKITKLKSYKFKSGTGLFSSELNTNLKFCERFSCSIAPSVDACSSY